MSIYFHTEDVEYNLRGKRKIRKWVYYVLKNEKKEEGLINIVLTGNDKILKLNQKYLSHNYLTDIITFNYSEKKKINGDLYICLDTVRSNATRFKCTEYEELLRVVVHGILHLIGYNDSNAREKEEMKVKEDQYLNRFIVAK